MCKLASHFFKASITQQHQEESKSFSALSILPDNQKDDIDLWVGIITLNLLKKSLDEGGITQRDVEKFYDGVWIFFITTYNYCVKWLPLDRSFYKSCAFVNFDERDSFSFTDVENVISSFGRLHEKFIEDPFILNIIDEEFMGYQSQEQIPSDIWKKAEVRDGLCWMDVVCGFLRTTFLSLSQIAMAVVVISHNNAGEERIFSILRKNKTEFRSRLKLGRYLNSIFKLC